VVSTSVLWLKQSGQNVVGDELTPPDIGTTPSPLHLGQIIGVVLWVALGASHNTLSINSITRNSFAPLSKMWSTSNLICSFVISFFFVVLPIPPQSEWSAGSGLNWRLKIIDLFLSPCRIRPHSFPRFSFGLVTCVYLEKGRSRCAAIPAVLTNRVVFRLKNLVSFQLRFAPVPQRRWLPLPGH
jgi:hypothetical protein